MNKVLMVSALLVVLATTAAVAQSETGATSVKVVVAAEVAPGIPKIRAVHLHATGIAANAGDPVTDVSHAKIISGGVRVVKNRECLKQAAGNREAVHKCMEVKKIGLIFVDEKKYRLRNVTIEKDSFAADIFDAVENSEDSKANHVGSIALARIEKSGKDIWSGKMKLEDKEYNTYFVGIKRVFTGGEAKEKVIDHARRNPGKFRKEIVDLCKENPDNQRCEEIKTDYCLKNSGDSRCRSLLREKCEKNANEPFCKRLRGRGKELVSVDITKVESEERVEEETIVEEKIETKPEKSQKTLVIRTVVQRSADIRNEGKTR